MKKSTTLNFIRAIIVCILPLGAFAQTATITGKITDAANEPLIGVTVLIQGTTIGTVTDINGVYTLTKVPNQPVTIVASFIGFNSESQQVDLSVNPYAKIDFKLIENIEELSEVVVIGYGTQKKSDLTSAVASVSAEDLEKSRATNVQEALQGRAAGVSVSTNTGTPGSRISVKIRGVTSITGTDPMWVIDGVPGNANSVNASDIESMEILKDASSAAIYGASAANGVILVTTKKGKAGDTKVTFNAYGGIQEANKFVDVNSGPEFIRMYHEYEALAGKRKFYSLEPDTFPTYNYQDMVFRKAWQQNYDIGVSGGSEKSTFYMGIGYLDQDGILKNSSYNKISVRLNGEHTANKWLKIGMNTSYNREQTTGFEEWELKSEYASPILQAVGYHAFVDPYGKKLTTSEYDDGWTFSPMGNVVNPLATIALKHQKNTNHFANGSLFAIVTPVEAIKFESRVNGNVSFNNSYNFRPIYYITGTQQNTTSKLYNSIGYYQGWGIQEILTFNKTFFDVHNITAMAAFESGYSKGQTWQATRVSLINQTPEMWYFDASTNDTLDSQIPDGSAWEESGFSYLGRISYDYKSMILAQFNVRKDYSSIFGPRKRSGVFPSFSAGFKFTELDVVKDAMPYLNFGKIRYGWGKSGNNSVRRYQYYPTVGYFSVFNYAFDDETPTNGAAPSLNANPAIAWEDVVTSNLGMDLQFLESRLTIACDYFERHNNGMLMEVPSPMFAGWYIFPGSVYQEGGSTGSSNAVKNVGKFSNKGVELSLDWKEKRGIVNYGANFNLTYVKTTVGKIVPDTIYLGNTQGMSSYLTRTISNQPFDIFYGFKTDGIFRLKDTPSGDANEICTNQPYTEDAEGNRVYAQDKAKPGDFRFKDINGDHKIDDKDMVALGSPHPKWMMGINLFAEAELPFNLGVVDAKAFFQGAFGQKVFNATKFYLCNTDGAYNWGKDYYDNHYQKELYDKQDNLVTISNDATAKYPRLDPTSANANFSQLSDFYVEDASYLRIKNVELGWTLPKNVTEIVDIEMIRLYVGAKNLYTFTKYSGLDPEVGGTLNTNNHSDPRTAGIDKAAYPTAKMYTFGINVTF
jgi:TonB-dependent starch-binding outer membrane protein SusC